MRAIWSGHITFGLVSMPVQLFAAIDEPGPGLRQVHATDGARIRHRRVCEAEGREVEQEEIARGWQAPDGRTVVLQDDDLDALPLPTRKTIEVLGFVGSDDVDPLMYSTPYWVGATEPAAQRPYALLVEALARHGTSGVCKLAVRSRERLAVLRPHRGVLVCHTLHWPEAIRDPGDIGSTAPVTEQELGLAEVLMDELAGVDIDGLRDEYAAALDQLVDAKISGGALARPPEPAAVPDLLTALEESIRQSKRR